MQLSKRQRWMLGALGLAVGGLLIDSMLPGPSVASAAMPDESGGAAAGAVPSAPKGTDRPATANANHESLMRVVERLRSVEHDEHDHGGIVPNPFAAMPATVASEVMESGSDDTEPLPALPEAVPVEAVPPIPSIRISSIMSAAGGRLALINGELRREGDRIGGWAIVRIEDRSIRLASGAHEISLPMDP